MIAIVLGGFFGAILGYFAPPSVVYVIWLMYVIASQSFGMSGGGNSAGIIIEWAANNFSWITFVTTITGMGLGVKIITAIQSGIRRRSVDRANSSRRTINSVILNQQRASMARAAATSIRTATPADITDLARVHVQSLRETYVHIIPRTFLNELSLESREAQWRRTFEVGSTVFVAVIADQIVGFVSCGRIQAKGSDGEVYALNLLRSHHGLGIGKALFEAALEVMRSQGKRRVIVWVLADNPARKFFHCMGGVQKSEKIIEIGGVKLLELGFAFTV